MNNTCCGHKNPLFIYELIDNSHIWLCAACVLFVYVKRTHSYVARYAGTHFTFVREIRPWRHRDISFAILFFFNFLSVHRFTLSVYASELQASLFFYLFFLQLYFLSWFLSQLLPFFLDCHDAVVMSSLMVWFFNTQCDVQWHFLFKVKFN